MPGIRDQIAAKRAETRSATEPTRADPASSSARTVGDEVVEDRTVSSQIRRAARSGMPHEALDLGAERAVGKLDISSFSLSRIPAEVYTDLLGIDALSLSSAPQPSSETITSKDRSEPEEVVSFKASDNEIVELDIEIGAFGGLKSIELRGNRLSSLPRSFADLLRLTSIDLSHNVLSDIPAALLLLPALQALDLSHNSINKIDFSSPIPASDEGQSYGAGFLSTSFSRASSSKGPKHVLPVLKNLNLGFNKLRSEDLKPLSTSKALRVLNLETNLLEGELDLEGAGLSEKELPELASLVLSGNKSLRGISGTITAGGKIEMAEYRSGEARSETSSRPAAPKSPSLAATLPIPSPTIIMVYRSVPAATFDSLPLDVDLDLYLPSEPAKPAGHPLVIWFHGGGLLQGNKENLTPHLRRLPSLDFDGEKIAVLSPNYRLAPQVPILDILDDITSLLSFVRSKLNDRLKKAGKGENLIDTTRICLSGGSAGGYLALIGGLEMPKSASDEEVGGYRGETGIKCIAPFCPITDLTDKFWSTEVNPVPWRSTSVTHEEAKPHIDLKAASVCTAVSGGPRSVLYSYMLQHSLFPSLLFMKQKAIGQGLDGFRPEPRTLSIPHRLGLLNSPRPPIYFGLGTADTAVQPMEKTLVALRRTQGELEVDSREGAEHMWDEDPGEECVVFREWLGKYLI